VARYIRAVHRLIVAVPPQWRPYSALSHCLGRAIWGGSDTLSAKGHLLCRHYRAPNRSFFRNAVDEKETRSRPWPNTKSQAQITGGSVARHKIEKPPRNQ